MWVLFKRDCGFPAKESREEIGGEGSRWVGTGSHLSEGSKGDKPSLSEPRDKPSLALGAQRGLIPLSP